MIWPNSHEEPRHTVDFLNQDKHPMGTETSNFPIRSASP